MGWFLLKRFVDLFRVCYIISRNHSNMFLLINLFFEVTVPNPATLLKKRLWHRCFPVNFSKFLREFFSYNASGGCFSNALVQVLLLHSFIYSISYLVKEHTIHYYIFLQGVQGLQMFSFCEVTINDDGICTKFCLKLWFESHWYSVILSTQMLLNAIQRQIS